MNSEEIHSVDAGTSVVITKVRLKQLELDSLRLECLRNAGVDNWPGWDDAMQEYREELKKELES